MGLWFKGLEKKLGLKLIKTEIWLKFRNYNLIKFFIKTYSMTQKS